MKNQVRSEVPVSSSIPMFKQFARVLESAVREDGTPLKHSHALHICARLHGLPNYNTLSAKPEVRPLSWERAMDVLTSQLTQYRIPPVSRERAAPLLAVLNIRFSRASRPLSPEEQAFAEQDDLLSPDVGTRIWDDGEHDSLPVPLDEHPVDLAYAKRMPRLLNIDEHEARQERLVREMLEALRFEDEGAPERPDSNEGYYDPFDEDREYEARLARRAHDPRAEAWELPGWEQGRSLRPGEGIDPPMDDDERLAMIDLEDARYDLLEQDD